MKPIRNESINYYNVGDIITSHPSNTCRYRIIDLRAGRCQDGCAYCLADGYYSRLYCITLDRHADYCLGTIDRPWVKI